YFVKQLRGLLIIGIQEKVFKDAVKEFVLEIKELTYKFIWIQRCEEVSMIKASRKI
ncbi:8277_t:CDS:1, partial [Rhizophagus irregularis]